MSFAGRAEIALDADVELLGAAFEPTPASGAQGLRFLKLPQAEKSPVEVAGGGFAAFRSGDLDMIELVDSKRHDW